jgi:hypothetical protein
MHVPDAVWFVAGDGRAPFAYYTWSRGGPSVVDLTLAPDGTSGRIHARELPRALVLARLSKQEPVWLVQRHRRDGAAEERNTWPRSALTRAGLHEDETRAFGSAVEVQLWSRDGPTG